MIFFSCFSLRLTSKRASAGFTLLEVMVAIAILGIALVVVMQLFSIGLKTASIEREYAETMVLARTKMNEAMNVADVENAGDSGSFESGQDWEISVEEFERPVAEAHSQIPGMETGLDLEEEQRFLLYKITVKVSWESSGGKTKSITLESLRLTKKNQEEVTSAPSGGADAGGADAGGADAGGGDTDPGGSKP